MSEFDVVIKGGMVFDGTGNPRFRADVGIKNGLIASIGHLRASEGRRVLDASGLHVAPGFIDLHTHYDSQLFWDPYCSISGWHGVTSVVIGNCGFSFAPVAPEHRERVMLSMTRNEAVPLAAMQAGMPWDWVTFPEFLDSVDRTAKSVNVLPYLGLSPLLIWVLGLDDARAGRMPTDTEHAEMRRLLNEAMDAGACGWSVQRMCADGAKAQRDYDGGPMATDLMHDETCLELARVLSERNEGFIQLTVITDTDPAHDLQHVEDLAEISGRPIIWNAIFALASVPDLHRRTISWLKGCQQRGRRVYGQAVVTESGFTFTFEDWNLWDTSDAWCEATLGTVEEKLVRLADPAWRARLKAEPPNPIGTAPMEDIVILQGATPGTKQYENQKIKDVCAVTGKDPIDALLDLAVADGLRTTFYTPMFDCPREFQRELLEYQHGLPGVSDGGAHTKFLTTGSWTTQFLVNCVRERAWVTLEDAHRRLSGFPAYCAGFRDRGIIREGAAADIVVYDYNRLEALPEEVAYDYPAGEWRRVQRGRGYRYVIVNGEVTIEDDKETGVPSGQLLRHGAAATWVGVS